MLAGLDAPAEKPWTDKRKALRQSFESFYEPVDFGEKLNPAWAVIELQKVLPDDSILTSGAGTYTHFFLRHYRFRILGTLFAPLSAPMGYSVPAAISIAMEKPESEIVSFVGDGCFLMNPQELVVAAKRNLRITVVMFNNEMYGSVRMHEEMLRPGMSVGTALDNPDFQALAGAFGLKSRRVVKPEDVAAVYVELRQETSGPIFIELMTDKDVITPHKTISQLREVKK
jgi:acetolactate synthase-1/2/3 large subunit